MRVQFTHLMCVIYTYNTKKKFHVKLKLPIEVYFFCFIERHSPKLFQQFKVARNFKSFKKYHRFCLRGLVYTPFPYTCQNLHLAEITFPLKLIFQNLHLAEITFSRKLIFQNLHLAEIYLPKNLFSRIRISPKLHLAENHYQEILFQDKL